MKYSVSFLILLGFVGIFTIFPQDADSMTLTADPMGDADVVVVGTIISAIPNIVTAETEYTVRIEEIMKGSGLLKNGNQTKTLQFFSPGYAGYDGDASPYPVYDKIFLEGDRALLLLYKKDEVFHESLLSRVTTTNCTGEQIMKLHYVPGSGLSLYQNDSRNVQSFYTNQPITAQYYYFNKDLKSASVNVTINVVDNFPDILKTESSKLELDECQAYAMAEMKFTIGSPGSFAISAEVEGGSMGGESYSGIDVIDYVSSPLKQIKSGVALIDVQCSEGKHPAYKYNRMRVACVSDETEIELITRGWATMRLAMPGDNISEALCNNYEGKWHAEYEGCRDVTDLQCSLMGGKFVENLKICFNDICPDKLYTLCVTNPAFIPRSLSEIG